MVACIDVLYLKLLACKDNAVEELITVVKYESCFLLARNWRAKRHVTCAACPAIGRSATRYRQTLDSEITDSISIVLIVTLV